MKADLINVDVGIGAIVQFGKLQAASVICGQGAALTDARRARRHSEENEEREGGSVGRRDGQEGDGEDVKDVREELRRMVGKGEEGRPQ